MLNIKRNQLSTLQVKNVKPGVYTDGGGLTLRVKPSGRRTWVLRLTDKGKLRTSDSGRIPTSRSETHENRPTSSAGQRGEARTPRHVGQLPGAWKLPSPRSPKPLSASSSSGRRLGQVPATRPNGERVSGSMLCPSSATGQLTRLRRRTCSPSWNRSGPARRRRRVASGSAWRQSSPRVKGGGILGHGVSMVRTNVRLSGQHKPHWCYP